MHTDFTAEIYSDTLRLYQYKFYFDEKLKIIDEEVIIANNDEIIHQCLNENLVYEKDLELKEKFDLITEELSGMLNREITEEIYYNFKDLGDVFRYHLNDIMNNSDKSEVTKSKPIKYMIKFTSESKNKPISRGSFSISSRTLYHLI